MFANSSPYKNLFNLAPFLSLLHSTCYNIMLVILVVFVLAVGGYGLPPPIVRVTSTNLVVRNVSVKCSELASNMGTSMTHVELTDDDKMELLREQGGAYANTFLAKSQEEADDNLPSLVALDAETKATILSNMQQHTAYSANLEQAYDDWISRATIKEYLIRTHKDQRQKDRLRRSLKSAEEEDTLLLPEEVGLDDSYAAPFGVEKLDYCLIRGGPFVDPLHLRMCTVCNSLREMEESFWPRYINEAICSPQDSYCLLVGNVPHGTCRENLMPIHILRKQPNACVIRVQDGRTLVADHWVKETISIRVGCECAVKSHSWLSSYV